VQPLPEVTYVPLYGQIEIEVESGQEAKDGNGSYIQYIIVVGYGGQHWQVARRFRTFEKLLATLQAGRMAKKLPGLPKTHMLWRGLDKTYVSKKAAKLDTFLKALCAIEGCANSPDMYNFLFKSRFTVGVRASFIGVPESDPAGYIPRQPSKINMVNMSAGAVDIFVDGPSNSNNALYSPRSEAAILESVAPPGSKLAEYLEMNQAEIQEHESCIAALKAEREARIRAAVSSTESSGEGMQRLDQNMVERYFTTTQGIECSAYAKTADAVAALSTGFILVTFPSRNAELAIQLSSPIKSPSATTPTTLRGTTMLDGTMATFEGTLMLAQLKGEGLLKVS